LHANARVEELASTEIGFKDSEGLKPFHLAVFFIVLSAGLWFLAVLLYFTADIKLQQACFSKGGGVSSCLVSNHSTLQVRSLFGLLLYRSSETQFSAFVVMLDINRILRHNQMVPESRVPDIVAPWLLPIVT